MTSNITIPNLISMARILLVPVVVWLISERSFNLAFCGFAIAGISDGIDGFIARHWNMRSRLGAFLDPLADKLLLVSSFVTLGIMGFLPVWLVILAVARDVLIVGGVVLGWVLGRLDDVKPSLVSKANTFAQIVLAGLVLLTHGFEIGLTGLIVPLEWLTAALTVLSGGAYVVAWLRIMSDPSGTT